MKILCITLEQSKLSENTNLLDYVTSQEINQGKQHEKYWLMSTAIRLQEGDRATFTLNHLLMFASMQDYQLLMIHKHGFEYKPRQPESKEQTTEQP